MMIFRLAYRNLVGAGLRTWLIVFVLSLSYVIIIAHKGLLDGWNKQAQTDMINWDVAGGQYWHHEFDPYDPFTIADSHGIIPEEIQSEISKGNMTPMLYSQATIYPEGRQLPIMLKGVEPEQNLIDIPTLDLIEDGEDIPAIIGTRMAKSSKLKKGDLVTVRWRDINGAYDAVDVKIVDVFRTNVPTLDGGKMYIPIDKLQDMLKMPGEASIVIIGKDQLGDKEFEGWIFRDQNFLMAEIIATIKMKNIGGSIMWMVLLLLALLAIFDTQVLSVFRRQKEIGTFVALGMTRRQIIQLFTVEGAMHGVLAAILAAIYGIPLLRLFAQKGFTMPMEVDDYGLAVTETIFPAYSVALVVGTVAVILITTTIVSYLPVRKISKMKPTDAIKGKLQ